MYSKTLYQIIKKGVSMKIWTAVSKMYYHNRFLINCLTYLLTIMYVFYLSCVLNPSESLVKTTET